MLCTGIFTITICRLGQNSKIVDNIHFTGAGIYMLQHIILMKIFNMKSIYKKCFYTSFVSLLTSIIGVRYVENKYNIISESNLNSSTIRKRQIQISRLRPYTKQRILFWLELLLMISENMLFTSFIHGITSGLKLKSKSTRRRRIQLLEQQQQQQQHDVMTTASLSDDDDDDKNMGEENSRNRTNPDGNNNNNNNNNNNCNNNDKQKQNDIEGVEQEDDDDEEFLDACS